MTTIENLQLTSAYHYKTARIARKSLLRNANPFRSFDQALSFVLREEKFARHCYEKSIDLIDKEKAWK